MPDEPPEMQSFVSTPGSPELDEPGVAIAFDAGAGGPFAPGEPILLHGTCGATHAVVHRAGGRALAATALIVVRRDKPAGWLRPVLDTSRLAPRPEPPEPPEDKRDALKEISYFNVELARFLDLPDEPGRYWVMAALADWVSQRLTFEIVPPEGGP